ncbi:MAG TPA: hypothetical protein VE465_28165 [Streptosporangiaceae bacterium]|nr:hypothetical protein [Streptosporangiaceae bacterium]
MTDDEELLGQIRAAFAALDPVPALVRDAALAAFATRRPWAVLAELSADSAGGTPAGTGVRGRHGPRLLVFTGPGSTVEIEVTGDDAEREIAGRLAPPAPADLVVRHPHGEVTAHADRAGHFVVPRVPAGPVSLVFVLPDASSIVTSWIRV